MLQRFRSHQAQILRWWRVPFWIAALITGAKSFRDNPLLGSRTLNQLGLHVWRVRIAHSAAAARRRRLARGIQKEWRQAFDNDGFVLVRNFLPNAEFARLKAGLFACESTARAQMQGDTRTSRLAVGPKLLADVPELRALLARADWRGLMAYVASTKSPPLYYLQAIESGVIDAPPDPQIALHADSFQPSLKAWLFLSDVTEGDRPLTYVAGSHKATPERLAWEKSRSLEVLESGDMLSQRGSLRVSKADLAKMGLPEPTHFIVPANTLVVADTCGFHARADGVGRTHRVELWAYCRRSPFLPWVGLDPLAFRGVAERRAGWLMAGLDWLDARGWARQHWQPAEPWRTIAESSG